MKNSILNQSTRNRLFVALALGLGLTTITTSLLAADKTWDGGGDQSSWSASPANWVGDVAPVATDSLFFDGSVGLAPNNDFAGSTVFNGITFNAGAGAFTMTGNEVNLAGGITNLSANPQTISFNLNQTGNRTHYAATNMTYDGVMKNNALIKRGPGIITLAGGTGNSSVRAEVYDGVVALAKSVSSTLGSSPIVVSDSGTLRIVGPGTDQIHFNQRVVVTNGGVFQIQNSFEEIGALSGSNSLTGIVENGLIDTTSRLDIGGGSGHEGIYSGIIRDGAGVLNIQVYRHDNKYAFNGTHTYSGTTAINNTSGSGTTRMIINGTHVGGGAYTVNGHSSTTDRLASLGGSGTISASVVNFNTRGILSPGGAISADMTDSATFADTTATLTFSNAVNLNTTTSTLDVQLSGTTAGSGYDQVNIAGSGTFSNNNANLKITLGYSPQSGDKFTIVQVPGTSAANNVGVFTSLNGVATDLSQGATFIEPGTGQNFQISYRADGATFDAGEGNGNDIMLRVVSSLGTNLVWRGDASSAWDITTTANWRNTNGVALTFTNGDNVTFNDTGSNAAPIDLTTDLTPGNIMVNATNNYVFGTSATGKLTGIVVVTKTNNGTLTILTDNDNSGSTIIKQGKVQIGTNGTSGTLSGAVTIQANGTLDHNRSDDVTLATVLTGNGSFLHTGTGALILSADSTFTGRTTNSGGMLQIGTGVGATGSIGGDINVSGTNVLRYYYAGDGTINNSRSGNGTVIFEAASGNRTFTIPTTVISSNFSGTNILTAGVRLHAADSSSTYAFGNGGSVFVPDFAQVWCDRSTVPFNQEFYIAGNGFTGVSPSTGAISIFGCTINGPVHLLADARIGGTINGGTISGKIDGAFQLEVLGNVNSFILGLGPTNGPNTYGNTLVTSGAIRALTAGGISTNSLTVDLNGEVNVYGNSVTVASLNNGGSGGGVIFNKHATTNGTLTVGTDDSSTSFDGVFGNGAAASLGLTKVGAGMLTLSGVNTNTGTVAVNGGTLALAGSGSFGNATNLAVATGATLDVSGRSDSTLTLTANQTLKHSGASTGPITVTGDLNMGGGILLLSLNRAGLSHDSLAVSGSTTISGTMAVTNIGAVLQAGDSFQLFPGATPGFAAFNLPINDYANNVIYGWNNTVASNGKITVASVTPMVNTNAPRLQVSVSANTLSLAWPTNAGWTLLTNSASLTATNQWFPYPNSANLTNVNVTIDPAKTNVFFKMQYPYP